VAIPGDSVENASSNLREALSLFFEAASPSEVRRKQAYVSGARQERAQHGAT
jgi:hypothetical protein